MRKSIQNRTLTFCQKVDFTLVGSGAPLFDSSYHSMERKGLLIIRMCSRPSGLVIPCADTMVSEHLNRGALAWGSSTEHCNAVFVQKAQLSY